ncbi:MAG TPA: hypothetical protein QGF02_00700 [Candidatus Babeliales bacterium]|nr:hypothetical protein [Candidatus Babeliales bacterium]
MKKTLLLSLALAIPMMHAMTNEEGSRRRLSSSSVNLEMEKRTPWRELPAQEDESHPLYIAHKLLQAKRFGSELEYAFTKWAQKNMYKSESGSLYEHKYLSLEDLAQGYVLAHRGYITDPETPKGDGNTPSETLLHFAVRSGALDILTEFTLPSEKVLDSCNTSRLTALDLAQKKDAEARKKGTESDRKKALSILNYLQKAVLDPAYEEIEENLSPPPSH